MLMIAGIANLARRRPVGAMPNGKLRQANLKILFQRAKQYESTSFKGLFNFINFLLLLVSVYFIQTFYVKYFVVFIAIFLFPC